MNARAEVEGSIGVLQAGPWGGQLVFPVIAAL